jgi:3-deoxy-D-manno-octulosonate 8-phosphate phosphatase (KDO 8-P phosphatase)
MAPTDLPPIDLLVLDVDGVMTDGRVVLSDSGDEIKAFNVRDGAGMRYWKRAGKKLAIITGRSSAAVTRRAKELDVDAVRLNAKDKLPACEEVLRELGASWERTAVLGDDLPDLPLLLRCGFPVAVGDAVAEVKQRAAYVTRSAGGEGCVREVIEMLLKSAGLWDGIMARYLPREGEAET